jgi:superfamily II DNA or RNA helicase
LTGQTPTKKRAQIIQDLQSGECLYLVATGQLIGEGFDLAGISTLALATPIKFSGRLIQYIGRALRPAPGKDKAVILDFVDEHPVFKYSAKSRMETYAGQNIKTKGIEHEQPGQTNQTSGEINPA